jgi:hypothetical protein
MLLACKLWDLIVMGGVEQTSPANAIFNFIAKVKACWNAILTNYLKIWMQKNKDKWPPDYLSWKIRTRSLMKWFISRLNVLCTFMAIKIKCFPSWSFLYLTRSKLFDRLKCESKVKTTEGQGVEAHSLVHSSLRVKGHVGASGWD